MLSLPFDKRVYAFVRRELPSGTALFYSRFYSAVAISFRVYLVFSQIFVFRGIASFFLSPRNFSKRYRRFTLHANSRNTRVKPVQPPGENMSTRHEDKVLFSVFFPLLLSWVFNQSREMVEFRVDNDRNNCEKKINELFECPLSGKFLDTRLYELSRCYLFNLLFSNLIDTFCRFQEKILFTASLLVQKIIASWLYNT